MSCRLPLLAVVVGGGVDVTWLLPMGGWFWAGWFSPTWYVCGVGFWLTCVSCGMSRVDWSKRTPSFNLHPPLSSPTTPFFPIINKPLFFLRERWEKPEKNMTTKYLKSQSILIICNKMQFNILCERMTSHLRACVSLSPCLPFLSSVLVCHLFLGRGSDTHARNLFPPVPEVEKRGEKKVSFSA